MSYRERRNFVEIMRTLGYPHTISVEGFRKPNFEGMAALLGWLVTRYDPSADIPTDVSSEPDRVLFLRAVAALMYTKARIRLNTRRLYQADGYALKELLKVATVLHSATRLSEEAADGGVDTGDVATSSAAAAAAPTTGLGDMDLQATRALASDITQLGASLYDALNREPALREARSAALARNLDLNEMRAHVTANIADVRAQTAEVRRKLDNLDADERNLEEKIAKKRQVLERERSRAANLAHVRPAFMDEYERYESELARYYELYVERFRNLAYLENQIERFNRAEQAKIQEHKDALVALRERLRQEDLEILRGDHDIDFAGGSESDESIDIVTGTIRRNGRPPSGRGSSSRSGRPSSAARRPPSGRSSASDARGGGGGGGVGGGRPPRATVRGTMDAPSDDSLSGFDDDLGESLDGSVVSDF